MKNREYLSMIPYGRQDINADDIDAVVEILQSDFLTQGPTVSLFEQEGDDLGARMLAAMRHASDRGLASVLMGSDCPELSEDRLDPVIDVVSAGPLWVFVPAHDGGYACVASSQPTSVPFERMTWGTADVMTHTRRRLIAANQCWIELPNVADIDRPEDLAALPETWEFG